MRFNLASFFIISLFVSAVAAQNDSPREQKIRELQTLGETVKALQSQIEKTGARQVEIEEEILAAGEADAAAAEAENAAAFRIFPRGLLDAKISIRGGAAYYSFTRQSHDYNKTPQIQLENGNLSVGFYGASYGFIADLQAIDFSAIDAQTTGAEFLINYRPPTAEREVREEYRKAARGFEIGGTTYQKQVSATVGHAYILRAVSFDEADTLVAFKVYRKDADGSLIIFWKNIRSFETPKLERDKTVVDAGTMVKTTDSETANTVRNALIEKGFLNVSVEATNEEVLLRGVVPKRKMAEAMRITQEIGRRKVRNELAEQ